MYCQFCISFVASRSADRDMRQHWLLKRAMRLEMYKMTEELEGRESGQHSQEFGSKVAVPQSKQEEVALTLQKLQAMLSRLLDNCHGRELAFVELLCVCRKQIDACLLVLRRSPEGNSNTVISGVATMVCGPINLASGNFAIDEWMDHSAVTFHPTPPGSPCRCPSLVGKDGQEPLSEDSLPKADETSSRTDTYFSNIPFYDSELPDYLPAMDQDINSEVIETLFSRKTVLAARRKEIGRDWCMNIFALDQASEGKSLIVCGHDLLHGPVSKGLLDRDAVLRFLVALQGAYRDNPYHNAMHAADVASAFTCLLRKCRRAWEDPLGPADRPLAKELNQAALTIAALAHDVGHFGLNNTYLRNSLHPLAVTYNDLSVMENLHCTVTFTILMRPECQIFPVMSRSQFLAFRKLIVDMILATDIKTHFGALSAFRLRLSDPTFSLLWELQQDGLSKLLPVENASNIQSNASSRQDDMGRQWHKSYSRQELVPATEDEVNQVRMALMRAADIGHSAKAWQLHVDWSRRITEEFHAQGDLELKTGLPVGPFNSREGFVMSSSQTGFLQFVAIPLWVEVARLDQPQHRGSGFKAVHDIAQTNLKSWQRLEESQKELKELTSITVTSHPEKGHDPCSANSLPLASSGAPDSSLSNYTPGQVWQPTPTPPSHSFVGVVAKCPSHPPPIIRWA